MAKVIQVRPLPFGSRRIFNEGCYWEGLMAFLSGPLSGIICCSWLHRLELLRQAQAKDGISGH